MEGAGLKITLEVESEEAARKIREFAKGLGGIPPAAGKAGTSLNNFSKSSNTATAALSNLSRVAQDAPFGFIGISNNLNPLLESFQRLKAESGSTKSALSALLGSLSGAGGIGLALGVVTAAFTVASNGLAAWGIKNKEAKKEVDDLSKSIAEFGTTINETAGKQLAETDSLVRATQNVTLSLKERNKAVDELQAKYPAYFGNLTNEQILAGNVGDAYKLLKDDILAVAKARAAQDILGQLAAKELGLIQKQIEQQRIVTQETAKFKKEQDLVNSVVSKTGKLAPEVIALANAFGLVNNALNATGYGQQQKALDGINKELKDLNKQQDFYAQFVDGATAATQRLGEKTEKTTQKLKDNKIKVDELKTSYRDFIGLIDTSGSLQNNRLIISVATKFQQEEIKKNIDDLVKFVNQDVKPTVTLRMDANIKALVDGLNQGKEELKNFAQDVNNIVSGAIASAAEGIGAAIAGSQNSLSAFIGVIANGLATIGQAMIAFGTAKIALSKLNLSGPAALAIGVGLEILAGILKQKVSQVKFADGGIVTGPTNALIGEAGPEVVFPLDRVREFLGNDRGTMQPIVLNTRVSGQDLILVQQRAGASFKRTNG